MKDPRKAYITPTMEDYLEAIFNLGKDKRAVRVKDIANRLGVKMPSVTSMLRNLADKGMIEYERYGYLELTEKGFAVGREVDRRHQTIRAFLVDILQTDYDQADKDACKMEHAISPQTLKRMVDFMEFIEKCPRGGSDWLENFNEYRKEGRPTKRNIEKMRRFAKAYNKKIKDLER